MLDTPLLFIIFNRPDTTLKVFERIRQVQPKFLFVAADGPREDREGEADKCALSREIATNIDWDCEVKTLFRDNNIGCGLAVSQAISWFFNHVEEGIILEDDCLADITFFSFCQELLAKYKNTRDVQMIAGTNLIPNSSIRESYFFSRLVPIWGWATWRRSWECFDYKMTDWQTYDRNKLSYFKNQRSSVESVFDNHYLNIDAYNNWDAQWAFTCFKSDKLTIIPKVNLVKNIGFGTDATHTLDANSYLANIKVSRIPNPIIHPQEIIPKKEFDIQYLEYMNGGGKQTKTLHSLILSKLKNAWF